VPGNSTGALNVNSVLESIGPWAIAFATFTVVNIAAAEAATINFLLNMTNPP
jgi:hypothetical protein